MTNSPLQSVHETPKRSLPAFHYSLKTRLRVYGFIGLTALLAWLYYAGTALLGLYDVSATIERVSEMARRATEAQHGLQQAEQGLDRYTLLGQGYDLSTHHEGRIRLMTALSAIRRRIQTEGTRGILEKIAGAEKIFSESSDRAIAALAPGDPAAARAERETVAIFAADQIRNELTELELSLVRTKQNAEETLESARNRAIAALTILAALTLIGFFWLLHDVDRRILTPCASTADALAALAEGRDPPRLPEVSDDEIGRLARSFNEVAALSQDHVRALSERDIQTSVNAVLTAAATVNDLKGFGSRVVEKVLEVSGASSAVLYLPEPEGGFRSAIATGGEVGKDEQAGREEAERAAREGKPLFLSVDAKTPTINLFDGRILPRESAHIPLVYFGEAVGVLSLGAAQSFTPKALNALAVIAPSLAVALANASANERVAEQSRRLTEQNELLEEQRSRIAQTARELQRASALKDRFLASVSHELRTPMTVILGFTGALLRGGQGELSPQQRESLERIERNARLLLGLINDVLDISKIEAGKAEIQVKPVSVPLLLKQVEADFADAARKKGLKLTTAAAPGLGPVATDPSKVAQILANLVGNALKFTDTGSITVQAEPRGEDWALIVSDTGIGIAPEEQDAIFEEFRQGERPQHLGRGGTGLGLAIVRKLAILLEGNISVESDLGKGSRFTLLLPVAPAKESPAAARMRSPPAEAAGSRKVLVVDDDEGIRKLLRFELEPYGLSILEAEDGRVALETARTQKPDAILLDVLMPGLDGWETLRALKESAETREIPVIILSVVENRAFGFAMGAFDYLVKPLAPKKLFEVLSRAGVLASRGLLLVVDDEADVRALLKEELLAAGYKVREAEGGEEALAEMEREHPSAVLLDLMMPPPDGFEVLYRMRQDPLLREVPVIIVSAKELTPADYERLNGSAKRIIKKGADMTRLIREVLRAIEQEKGAERVESA